MVASPARQTVINAQRLDASRAKTNTFCKQVSVLCALMPLFTKTLPARNAVQTVSSARQRVSVKAVKTIMYLRTISAASNVQMAFTGRKTSSA